MKNHKWGTKSFIEDPINIVLFISRNKDNKDLKGFKERRYSFITPYAMGSAELKTKFAEFVYSGLKGELCRCYYSANERDPIKIHNELIHFLIDHPDFNLCDINPKLAGIANTKGCAKTKRWLFDFDIDDEVKVKEFMEDIKAIDATVELTCYKTPHGYGILASHGFDTRKLYEKWDRGETECKKDDLMCVDWAIKE